MTCTPTLPPRLRAAAAACADECPYIKPLLDRIWALGPRGVGPNTLLAPLAGSGVPLGGLFGVPQPLVVRPGRPAVAGEGGDSGSTHWMALPDVGMGG